MNIYITIGGNGTRLKQISPVDKHLLYYKDKRIIEWILDIVPEAKILGEKKTKNRKETLKQIYKEKNVLIIDCDIIPFNLFQFLIPEDQNALFVFESNKHKYGSVIVDENQCIINSSEHNNISNIKCSGVYYIKNIDKLLQNMIDDNSIVSGMMGAKTIHENTFLKLGDIEDYVSSIIYPC